MNVKKILTILLAVFLLTAVCCGTVSAFTVSSESVSPSGKLASGDSVTASAKFDLTGGTYGLSSRISFDTPLVGDSWTIEIISGGVTINTINPGRQGYIDGYNFYYDAESKISVKITVRGKVSPESAGKWISALQVNPTGITGASPYTSAKQYVYDEGEFNVDLAQLGKDISALDSRISFYAGYEGFDVSNAQSYTNNARSYYNSAVGVQSDVKKAYPNVDSGNEAVRNAQMKLALVSLSLSSSYLNAVSGDVAYLKEKGWNTEALNLDTKKAALNSDYKKLYDQYMANTVPNADELDALARDSVALHDEGLGYIEKADNPVGGLLGILPFILIGLGVVAVGVVVFLLVRRRRNSWDELG